MAKIEEHRRFTIHLGESDNPVLILRRPTLKELRSFLQPRFEIRENCIEDHSVEVREEFIDSLLVGCENIEIRINGIYKPLSPEVADWKELIPLSWKISVALQFEEQKTISEKEVENFKMPSE